MLMKLNICEAECLYNRIFNYEARPRIKLSHAAHTNNLIALPLQTIDHLRQYIGNIVEQYKYH